MFRRLFSKSSSETSVTQKQPSKSTNTPTAVEPIFLPPFRPLNDFSYYDKTGWNQPDFSDRPRLKNRVINNLIFYQRNYFVLGLQILAFTG